ncbi:MAG: glyoxalase/bleomycin resistance/dioxygenase family protein [Burkholderiaceae bacterium]|nr:glyoxalase/bleomycin resistance/dioxygenase family protein [Burkholderiaceae bacterium]
MTTRLHVHLSVQDLAASARFYSALFGKSPAVERSDYAKWMLDDPRLNFAVSQLGHAPGLDHLGLQVETTNDLDWLTARLRAADLAVQDRAATTCCYARSDKGWVHDPQAIPWEAFVTHGPATTYGIQRAARDNSTGACCAPAAPGAASTSSI